MADYGVQAEGILKPKGNFHLIEGEDVRDVLLVVNSLEVPLPSTTLKDGLLCWNIEHQSFYVYNSNAGLWGQKIFGIADFQNGLIIQDGKAELGGTLVKPTTIDADNNSFSFLNLANFAIQNSGTHQWLINDTGFEWSSSPTGMYFIWKPSQFSVKNSGNTSFEFDNATIIANNSLSLTSLFNFSITSLDFKNAIHKPTSQMANANIPDWQNVLEVAVKREAITFGQKNWVGSNVVLKRTDVADLNFYTVKRNAKLSTLLINVGAIGTDELNKTITVEVYKRTSHVHAINGQPTATITDIQTGGYLIYSATTVVAGENAVSSNFQRLFENLNISIAQYNQLYVVVTVNQLSTLNNLSVQLELQEA